MYKILLKIILVTLIFINSSYAEIIKDIKISGNERVSSETIKIFTTVNVTNKFINDMKKNNWGRIINITSIAGIEISGPSTFNASKAALTAYTRSVGRQLAIEKRNIVMTAVAPGIVVTEKGNWNKKTMKSKHAKNYLKYRTALGRFGTIEELTGIIVFLSSDKASFFHGSIIQPDGGQSRQYMSFNYL